MGLDAVVYKKAGSFPPAIRDRVRLVDSTTGQHEFVGNSTAGERELLEATNERIGNISTVYGLGEEISRRFGSKCEVLLTAVLYSGSHSGEALSLLQMEALDRELDVIAAEEDTTGYLGDFVAKMRRLIAASKDEGNPVVFV
jgi:hypothetical protein